MKEILQMALTGLTTAVTKSERLAWAAILAIALGSIIFLSGCGSTQLPQINVEVIPPGSSTKAPNAAAAPPPTVVVVPQNTSGAVSVPQK